MFLIDLDQGRIIDDTEFKETLSRRSRPTRTGSTASTSSSTTCAAPAGAKVPNAPSLLDRQQAFGFSQEDIKFILEPMAKTGEATGSMGNDTPLAVLSAKNKPLYNYFRQLVRAGDQPADRPDPRTDGHVAGLLHRPEAEPARHQRDQPALPSGSDAAGADLRRHGQAAQHRRVDRRSFHSAELDICYPLAWGKEGVEARLASLCAEAEDAVQNGLRPPDCLRPPLDPGSRRDPGAARHVGRASASWSHAVCVPRGLVVETGSARETITLRCSPATAPKRFTLPRARDPDPAARRRPTDADGKAIKHFVKGVGKGLLKVMSKMGISTYMSYTGAQIFEAIGLQKKSSTNTSPAPRRRSKASASSRSPEEAIRQHRWRSATIRR